MSNLEPFPLHCLFAARLFFLFIVRCRCHSLFVLVVVRSAVSSNSRRTVLLFIYLFASLVCLYVFCVFLYVSVLAAGRLSDISSMFRWLVPQFSCLLRSGCRGNLPVHLLLDCLLICTGQAGCIGSEVSIQ